MRGSTESEEADMEQSTSEEDMHFWFSKEEIQVAQVLCDLESIIAKSEYRDCWPLTWGSKRRLVWGATKRRSSVDSGLSMANLATSSALSVQKTSQNERETQTPKAASPSTPLAFSPSTESDDKSKHCPRRNYKKRSREDLLMTIKELTENRIALRGELERVRNHYKEVLAYNRDLKAMKAQMESSRILPEPPLEINQSPNLGLNLGFSYQIAVVPVAQHQRHQVVHHQPQPTPVVDPRAAELLLQSAEQFHHQQAYPPYAQVAPSLYSANSGLGRINHLGLLGTSSSSSSSIPDLNVSVDESCRMMESFQPLDYSRARALAEQRARYAEARRERQMKRKIKQPSRK